MDIQEKQAMWNQERPLFEAEFIHSYLLPLFSFNGNTGDYEIKTECVVNADDEDQKIAYETLNTGWVMWLRAKRAQADAANQLDQMTISFDRFEELINKAVNAVSKTVAVPEGFVSTLREPTREIYRTDFEIIKQTLELVDLLASSTNVFQRDPKSKVYPFESENPRVTEWWRTACQIQELLTNTDPNNCDFEEYKATIEAQERGHD